MRSGLLVLIVPLALATPALAQDPHAGHQMPAPPAQTPRTAVQADPHAGHQPPAAPAAAAPKPPADPHAAHQTPASPKAAGATADPHAGHQMPATPSTIPSTDPHAGHQMPAAPAAAGVDPHAGHAMPGAAAGGMTAAQQPVGNAPAPSVIRDNAADRVFAVRDMERARSILAKEHGASRISKVMANFLEWQDRAGGGGYRWDVEGWTGGDLNRFVVKTEGEGSRSEGTELAEVQALYSRAVARYTDVQVGIRHDLEPGPSRTHATVGFESMFPYWFEVEGAAFLSNKGELRARIEGSYDFRLTQRWILQPQAELGFSAEDIPEIEIGSGVTHVELGLRLRYEIRREFAPYVGISFERSLGRTADFVRRDGDRVENTTLVIGLRTWF